MARFLALALMVACAGSPVAVHEPKAPKLSGDDRVLAAVLAYEIAAAGVTPAEAICVRVRIGASSISHDASDALLDAMATTYPIVVAGSGCSGGGWDPVTVSATPGRAVMFEVGPVVRDGGVIRVEGGGGHRGGGSIREVEYRVIRHGSKYRVVAERLLHQT